MIDCATRGMIGTFCACVCAMLAMYAVIPGAWTAMVFFGIVAAMFAAYAVKMFGSAFGE